MAVLSDPSALANASALLTHDSIRYAAMALSAAVTLAALAVACLGTKRP